MKAPGARPPVSRSSSCAQSPELIESMRVLALACGLTLGRAAAFGWLVDWLEEFQQTLAKWLSFPHVQHSWYLVVLLLP